MFDRRPIFADRRDAGRQLAKALERFAGADPLVLALPRGGVPVGYEVAKALRAPLDVVLVRKIGAPGHEELGIGAVVDGTPPQTVLNDTIVGQLALPPGYIEETARREIEEIERRRRAYVGDRKPTPIDGRTVLVVDDGIATGGTVRAVLAALSKSKARQVVLAVPVAPEETVEALRAQADEVVCLATPAPFYAIAPWYGDFGQTADEEVVELLEEARGWMPGKPDQAAAGDRPQDRINPG